MGENVAGAPQEIPFWAPSGSGIGSDAGSGGRPRCGRMTRSSCGSDGS